MKTEIEMLLKEAMEGGETLLRTDCSFKAGRCGGGIFIEDFKEGKYNEIWRKIEINGTNSQVAEIKALQE